MIGKLLLIALFAVSLMTHAYTGETAGDLRRLAREQEKTGNFRDAAELYRQALAVPDSTPAEAALALRGAFECYRNLDRSRQAEEMLAVGLAARPGDWRMLATAAELRVSLPFQVVPDGDDYVRPEEWAEPVLNGAERDRVIALRQMRDAEALLAADPAATADDRVSLYEQFLDILLFRRDGDRAWRLTALTDLAVLPEPEDYQSYWAVSGRGAPVDRDGAPLYHALPDSWDVAASDGERMRLLLARLAAAGSAGSEEADWRWGRFLLDQFGVQTVIMAAPLGDDADIGGETGPYAVRTLAEDETIARLATGIKRFHLPDEYNYIRVLRKIARDGATRKSEATTALARIFENRQQYPKALSFWLTLVPTDKNAAEAAARIAGNSGMLETGPIAPAGKTTTLSYLYRNGGAVTLTARRLDEGLLLADIRAALKESPRHFYETYHLRRPERLGRMIVEKNDARYVKETTAQWEVALAPPADHFSARAEIELPFTDAGCYLVEAAMKDGNTSRLVLWIADLALVRKTYDDALIFFIADAVSGEPAAGAELSLFGFSAVHDRGSVVRPSVLESAFRADENGLVVVDRPDSNHEWLAVATTADGKLAYLGFDHVWGGDADQPTSPATSFLISDRPVYRPGQDVHFKAWVGRGSYGQPFDPKGKTATVRVLDPQGTVVYEKKHVVDEYGGIADSLRLDAAARLGVYAVTVEEFPGHLAFRLEEYRKPEYEVAVDAPAEAVRLGGVVPVTVRAAYYFGASVTDAVVSYKVLRTPYVQEWTPSWRWDWLYGPGAWLPEPAMPWRPRLFAQPELAAEGEATLDENGEFRLNIDTAPARELFGAQDHRYEVTVEVRDQSRRTIVGVGSVVATRTPFSVMAWAARGLHWVGDEASVNFQAVRPLTGGIDAEGTATLHRIHYTNQGATVESEVERRAVAVKAGATGSVAFRPDAPGQYRVRIVLTDAAGNAAEGETVLTVRGAGASEPSRFSPLELVADRSEYAVGETARLAVNSARANAFVLFFPRAERNAGKPRILRLENGTRVVDLAIGEDDQPNFFCEAITVFDGAMHRLVREVFVPPADRTLTLDVRADKQRYAPGETATFTVAVADGAGRPVRGQLAVAVYDKAVEYIAGGPGGGDIRAHFWGWRRYYSPTLASSLARRPYTAEKPGDVSWMPLGIFGGEEADWRDDAVYTNGRMPQAEMALDLAPAAAPPMMLASAASPRQKSIAVSSPDSGGAAAEPAVRSEFADTALWIAALETDDAGRAEFTLTMPDNLTAWTARAWGMAAGVRVGVGDSEVETAKNLIVRPQTPRFLVQKDRAVLSANIHNYLPRAAKATVELILDGGLLEAAAGTALRRDIELAAGGEARVDWPVLALRPGQATVTMRVIADEESDAARTTLPVLVHGAKRVQPFGGILRRSEDRAVLRFSVPEERLADQSRLELTFSPGIAAQLLGALPFLLEYPYGCTEQTLNRFLPAVMTRRYLDGLGASLAEARAWTAANVPGAEAVFDDAALDALVARGVGKLAEMQNPDGGWGWFSGAGEQSWPHTTAVVMHGLAAAGENGAAIPFGVLDAGTAWLRAHRDARLADLVRHVDTDGKEGLAAASDIDAFIHMILVERGHGDPAMRDFLFRDRLSLSLAAQCMLGSALHRQGATDALAVVLGNLRQHLVVDQDTGSARLRTPAGRWWLWHNDDIETQAWYLRLLAATDPRGDVAAGVARTLLHNRVNGAYWRSTRDTGLCIEALIAHAVASGEADSDQTVTLYLDGSRVMERRFTAADIAGGRFVLDGLAVEAGEHELALERAGGGAVYYGGGLSVFSLEDAIAAAGRELTVERAIYRLTPAAGDVDRRTDQGRAVPAADERYRRERIPSPFENDAVAPMLTPGDLVEVELRVVANNNYEYVIIEDMKAAGCEAVALRSGYDGNPLGAYVEYRDQRVSLFVRSLPRGEYVFSYRLRAETPGRFSALPATAGGMYATDLAANSDETTVTVTE